MNGLRASIGALLAALWWLASGPPAVAAGNLPIIDAHEHLLADMSAESLIQIMDRNGISRMVLMPNGFGSTGRASGATDQQAIDYAARFPGRFIPFVSLMTPVLQTHPERWRQPDDAVRSFLASAEDKLNSGRFYGMGELIVRHYGYRNADGGSDLPDFNNPLDSPLVHQLADMAARHHVVITIHAEGEPAVVDAMGRVLAAHPGAVIVWAHLCGRSQAPKLREMLTRYPNLMCDLGGMNGTFGYGKPNGPRNEAWSAAIDDAEGNLLPDMQSVLEVYADRFLGVGMDAPQYGNWRGYDLHVRRFRHLLSQLTPATRRKIAHENAEHLFRLPAIDAVPGSD